MRRGSESGPIISATGTSSNHHAVAKTLVMLKMTMRAISSASGKASPKKTAERKLGHAEGQRCGSGSSELGTILTMPKASAAVTDHSGSPLLGAIPAVAIRELTDRAQEIDPPEVWPIDIGEVVLRFRPLPEHEAAESLFARGPND